MRLFTLFFFSLGILALQAQPANPAPNPIQEAENVISLFSDAYDDVPVDTWRTDWSAADFADIEIAGNPTKRYSNLDFVGIETVSNQLDISAMTHFRIDVWSADFTFFGIKLVDFGADGQFGGGDDVEHQVNFEMPAQGEWVSFDIPLSDFVDLTTRQNIAQLILVGQPTGATTVYIDNVFFYAGDSAGETEPSVAAPTPTRNAENVISMFSDVYEDVAVDTWRTDWSAAILEDIEIQGNATKKYSELDFVGIETVSNQLDVSEMTHFHMHVWSADYTFFGIKLVDFGADGEFGGGDDVEHQVNFEMPAQGQWVSFDIPLSDFVDLTTKQNVAQLILVAQPTGSSTVFIDNVYFYKEEATGVSEPEVAAPAPLQDPANVISMFSDAYEDVPVDTWRTDWSAATLEYIEIQGNATKKYSELDFVGIETVSNQLDISEMTHFHIHVWSADYTFFGIKLVDFGADGEFGGGDDVEHQVNFEMPAQGQWVSFDIPLSDFVDLTTRQNIAQLILVAQPSGNSTIFVDNVYFYTQESIANEPSEPAPLPTRPESAVISMFSEAYTAVPIDTWRTDWSAAILEDIEIQGNPTKKYSQLDFVGIETVANQLDITGMTHFHLNVWSADFDFFGIKLVDFGADGQFGGGDDVEHQIDFEMPARGEWLSLDIPLSDFEGLITRQNIAQLILVGRPTAATTVFVDNVYFYDATVVNTSEPVSEGQNILVFPNPLQSGSELFLSQWVENAFIIDLNGKILHQSRNTNSLSTANLQPGAYIIKLMDKKETLQSSKLIIK